MPKGLSWHWLMLFALGAVFGPLPALADMVVLTDGKVRAGRIVADGTESVTFQTAGKSDPVRTTIARKNIQTILRDAAETQRIEQTTDAAVLLRWADEYWRADDPLLALKCLQGELRLDTRAAPVPLKDGPAPIRPLRNRLALRHWDFRTPAVEAPELLRRAQWARDAGLDGECERYLRRAFRRAPDSEQVWKSAAEWRISLGPLLRPSLDGALTRPLIEPTIIDEMENVAPQADQVFVTIPFQYTRAAAGLTLSRGTLRGKDGRALYGLRTLQLRDGLPVMEPVARDPVYERMQFRMTADGQWQIGVRNSQPPRKPPSDQPKPERSGPRDRTVVPTGWAALVFEVSRVATQLSFEWPNEQTEEIDLAFLGRIGDFIGEPELSDPSSAPIRNLLRYLLASSDGPKTSMTVLAMTRLSQLRQQLGPNASPAWVREVSGAMLGAGAARPGDLGESAWRYFVAEAPASPITLALLAKAPVEIQLAWAYLIDDVALRSSAVQTQLAADMLGAMLGSRDALLCEEAIDALLSLGASGGARLPAELSTVARAILINRLDTLSNRSIAQDFLRQLMLDVRPGEGPALSELAARLTLKVSQADLDLLKKWRDLPNDAARAAFLDVLQSADLSAIRYTHAFFDIIKSATEPGAADSVREAAFRLAVSRARMVLGSPDPNVFPLAIPRDAADPILIGLSRAASRGSAATRVRSMETLVSAGLVEEAMRGLHAPEIDDAMRAELLRALAPADDPATQLFATAAALGYAIRPDWPAASAAALDGLGRLAAAHPPATLWRTLAAMKTTVDLSALSRMSLDPVARTFGPSLRWLFELTHLSPQERLRFTALTDDDARRRELEHADRRRSRLVDGRYGVLVIVETTTALRDLAAPVNAAVPEAPKPPDARPAWSPPVRTTFILPLVRLELADQREEFFAKFADTNIGRGRPLAEPRPLAGPSARRPILEALTDPVFVGRPPDQPDGAPPPDAAQSPIGPLALPALETAPGDSGSMLFHLDEFVRTAARDAAVSADAVNGLIEMLPKDYRLYLGYVQFGSYCGWGPRRPPPEKAKAGTRHLLNVMVLLEPADR